ncbi:unnamed protein product [Amoebophrya sp. A25]|nr:unnamed protein product [Amoebophrya sp. A25]|eukprot:GSA25T00015542001.1
MTSTGFLYVDVLFSFSSFKTLTHGISRCNSLHSRHLISSSHAMYVLLIYYQELCLVNQIKSYYRHTNPLIHPPSTLSFIVFVTGGRHLRHGRRFIWTFDLFIHANGHPCSKLCWVSDIR